MINEQRRKQSYNSPSVEILLLGLQDIVATSTPEAGGAWDDGWDIFG